MERYISKYLVYSLVWSFAGDCKLKQRQELGDYIRSITTIQLPPNAQLPLIDYEVCRQLFIRNAIALCINL